MRIPRLASILFGLAILLAAGAVSARPVRIPLGDGEMLQAELFRPDGPATAPAVVALHGCGGPFPSRDAQWRKLLTDSGHIVLFPDSFGSRGLGSQCRITGRDVRPAGLRRTDAIASAAWLTAQPGTPAGGVLMLGWSDGGSTVLATGRAGDGERSMLVAGLVRGLIAFYPGCRAAAETPGWRPTAPLLILIGEEDDWTPAAPCRALSERVGPPLTLVTYPGAYHDFDTQGPVRIRANIPASQRPDHTVHAGGNPVARQDAITRVMAFIAQLPPATR